MATKKERQQQINAEVIAAIEKFNSETANETPCSVNRLRYCSAYVETYGNYFLLISYRTPIALIDFRNGICYDFLRYVYDYTNTSAQHIAKFSRDYAAQSRLTYMEV